MTLSAIVPATNRPATIGALPQRARARASSMPEEIVVVEEPGHVNAPPPATSVRAARAEACCSSWTQT